MDKELTFEQVRDGIIRALKHAYPDCDVRSDYTPQNVSDGDFNVLFVTSQTPEHVGDYWKHSVTFDVVYYCGPKSITDDTMRVCTEVPLLLETITTPSGAKLHPVSVEPATQDDKTVHIVVRYDYHVKAWLLENADDSELMMRLQLHMEDLYVEKE
jgi:hypothetical protein